MIQMRYLKPHEELQGLIGSYYVMEPATAGPISISGSIMPQWANIRWLISGQADVEHFKDTTKRRTVTGANCPCMLFGPTFHPSGITLNGKLRLVGAGILPLGWHRLFGRSAKEWAHEFDDIQNVWRGIRPADWANVARATDDEELGAALDHFFLDRLKRSIVKPWTKVTTRVAQLLLDTTTTSVEMVAQTVGITVRQVERISGDVHGLSPKQVIRKFRFLRTMASLIEMPGASWLQSIDKQYYDQSHFIRDFKQFTGMTPNQFLRRPPLLTQGFLYTLKHTMALQSLPHGFNVAMQDSELPRHREPRSEPAEPI